LRDISNPDKHRQLTATGGGVQVQIVYPDVTPFFIPKFSTKCRAKRPDGNEVEVELVGSIQILLPIKHTTLGPIGHPIEEAIEKLISEVRLTLEAFKHKLK
jgi:hypothetical protein